MKYCLSPRESPRAEPEGFSEGLGNFSLYTPPQLETHYSHSQLPLLANILIKEFAFLVISI